MSLCLEKGIILRPLENVCGHPYVCVKSFFIFGHSLFKLLTCFSSSFPLGLTQARGGHFALTPLLGLLILRSSSDPHL